MATGETKQVHTLDLRIYIGMLFFRWQIIVVCFLYSLLGGVLYLNLAPKKYSASCKIMVFRDPKLVLGSGAMDWNLGTHVYLLQSNDIRSRVVRGLQEKWGKIMGSWSRMLLSVGAYQTAGIQSTLHVYVSSENQAYAVDFLRALIPEYRKEWQGIQMEASDTAGELLEEELRKLEEKVRAAQDDIVEYQRLHDITRLEARATMEGAYFGAVVTRRNQLTTELMLMENQYPFLREAGVGVIEDAVKLSKDTGNVEPLKDPDADKLLGGNLTADQLLPESLRRNDTVSDIPELKAGVGWPELRVEKERLLQKDRELAQNLTEDHPSRKETKKRIQAIESQLEVAAQVALKQLRDRHTAIRLQLNAVEQAEYKWQAKDLQMSQRRAEMSRMASVVSRYEANYATLYGRLHEMRVAEELKAEHFRVVEDVSGSGGPVWPNPQKILIVAVAIGLASGFGLALLAQLVDNKMQSIRDVEEELGIPFLGGVPYWAHSGLERTIRPIVTEEHSSGAIEAYRALRTSLLSALNKMNEKVVLVTSADSREGKTLTTLNLAIMIAQMNKRVLLVDMDLRRGRLHRSLGLEKEPGVTDILLNRGRLRDVIEKTRVPNLDLVPTGKSTENSAEMLQSSDLVGMFVDVQDEYDYILVDTSPVLRVTDTVVLATAGVGVVLYVARVNHTPKPLIRYSLDMLKDARVVGLIMNSIEMHKISSLYYAYQYPNYAYYSNAYSYGYNYYDYGDRVRGRKRVRRGKPLSDAARKVRDTLLPMD